MHAQLDKTNTGELSLASLKHYIAQADLDEEPPQGLVVGEEELPRWFVYTLLFSAAGILTIVLLVLLSEKMPYV